MIAFINSHAWRDSVINEVEVTQTPQAVSFMTCVRVAAITKNNCCVKVNEMMVIHRLGHLSIADSDIDISQRQDESIQ